MSVLSDLWKSSSDDNGEEVDKRDLVGMDPDELAAKFALLNVDLTRLVDKAMTIQEILSAKGADVPDNRLAAVLSGIEKTAEPESDPEPLREEPERPTVPGRGSKDPIVAMVGASPSKLDLVRKSAFSGPVGRTVREVYLKALGVEEEDVYLDNLVPVYLTDDEGNPREPTTEEVDEHYGSLLKRLSERDPDYVVALGTTARDALGDISDVFVPHPRAVNIWGDSGEVGRKMEGLAKKIETGEDPLTWEVDDTREMRLTKSKEDNGFSIVKTDDEEQIVTGVVYEPHVEDTDGNWTTPDEIEKAQRLFMKNPKIGHEHQHLIDDAYVVESYIAPQNMEIGGETVKKGAWVMSVKIENEDRWNMVKNGDYNGFSLGGRANINEDMRLQ